MNNQIIKAIKIIKSGELVAFPTETVYGLGADATNEDACKKIFSIKGRPQINPLIVHVPNVDIAKNIAVFNDYAEKLVQLWPGPLTLVLKLKKHNRLAPSVLAGLNTVAIRLPSHPVALQLLQNLDCPLAAPSANHSGYVSSTKHEHVLEDFSNTIFVLKDNYKNAYGLESTIVDLTTNKPTILRSGVITAEDITGILEEEVLFAQHMTAIKAPGMLNKHYSTHTPIRLNVTKLLDNEIGINFADSNLSIDNIVNSEEFAYKERGASTTDCRRVTNDNVSNFKSIDYSLNLSKSGDLLEVASKLYEILRVADKLAIENNKKQIAIAPIPSVGIGIAINDRLKRAASKY